ncbi:alpha/beta fold hydrolase [Jannaschia seohaensis]|uniref:Pimeloyl-ACP methyl ester carboxylesterase n=1 Tax=Jannaschia seohaensis TaxID=475081 RepID=A0A2Y9A4H3_9RHOB|nr:alpha/beta fold hydrolase [Jannaschia seohaensis]PWJ22508.1 pimeloyl-ACP methyl ester carboxylesterase [Jannaschia seohaensis]SSA38786.1 Pimeloyl-ACP methyl ester carboxylesterase [Jannaschia seohaensis]
MLNMIRHGSPTDRPPLLIAHGLFGSARNWGVIAKRLSDTREVVAVDMRNHGASFWDAAHGYEDLAADLAEVIGDRPHDVLGHSMGGKAAMVLALTRPEAVQRLVVADIAPVGYRHTQGHLIDAMRAVDLSRVTRRSDAAAQLTQVPEDGTRSFLLQSLDVAAGRWTLNLDALADEMDRIIGFPEIEGRFDGPTLFLSGANSDYVRAEHRDRILALFPGAKFARIPGAGHWLHAEKPREFEAAIRVFLDK